MGSLRPVNKRIAGRGEQFWTPGRRCLYHVGPATRRVAKELRNIMNLKDHIREVPDFPKPGILFYDISTLLQHADAWRETVDRMADAIRDYRPDRLIGIESRGFLVAAPLALHLGCGFTMVRKKGKLPGGTISHSYDLEYGTDTIEIQDNAIEPGQRVVVLDDLLATGGTMEATIQLLRRVGAEVCGVACIMELTSLNGRSLIDAPITTQIAYDE